MIPSLRFSLSTMILSLLAAGGVMSSQETLFAQAQEAPKPQAQEAPKYTAEEYKAYQELTNETDPTKKMDLIVKFLQDRPQSTLREHAIAGYQTLMNQYQSGEKWAEMVSTGERYLAIAPDDIFTVSMLTTAYQKTGNLQKFAAFAEKVFEKNPSPNTAYYLAKAYLDLKNTPKFIQWGEKTVELIPDNHEIILELTKQFGAAEKNTQAAKYARLCVKAIQSATRPEAASEKVWKDYTTNALATCYNVIGQVAYKQQDYATSIANLENSLRYYGRNDFAYYHLAHSYWQQGKVDIAMKNFAKAYLLKTRISPTAKQHLDNLYKSTHQNSLVGQERVIEKARQELGGK